MLKKIFKSLSLMTLLVLSIQMVPAMVHAAKSPEDTGLTYECYDAKTEVYGNCTFADLVEATRSFINKVILIVLQLTIFVIAWAGYKYMISGGNSSERTAANKMLWSVAKGIAIIMLAWLLVNLIATTLLNNQIVNINIIKNDK